MNHTFNTFKSPHGERSMFKNIPMSHRDHPFVQGMTAVGCRIRYRGPREHGGYHTLRERATPFSIYPPSQIREWSRENGQGWTTTTFWPWERPSHRHLLDLEERLAEIRDEMEVALGVLHDGVVQEKEILSELNRYNSVTKLY